MKIDIFTSKWFTRPARVLLVFTFCLSALFFFARNRALAGGRLYAAPSALGAGDCSAWQNACTLQAALAAAQSGDEIWVKAGVHLPSADPTDRNAMFTLKSGVALYGGFAGSETDLAQRNWLIFQTILSGDIDGDDLNTDGNFIAESTADIQGANSKHVVYIHAVADTGVLDGFVITAGKEPGGSGAGVYMDGDSHPVLRNLAVIGNFASSGGGMYLSESGPSLLNVRFINNYAEYRGGAIRDTSNHNPTITNALFIGNGSADVGGAIETNYSKLSSGLLTLTNVLFSENYTAAGVAGIFLDNTSLALNNVTFSRNVSPNDPAAIYSYQSGMTFNNVILWGDTSPGSVELIRDSYSVVTIRSSDINGCGASGATWNAACGTDGGGNIQADPAFIAADDGNLRLSLASPAIDAGDNSLVPAGVTVDPDGNPRFVDHPAVSDSGLGVPPIVDIGAYEAFPDVTAPTLQAITRLDPNPTNAGQVRFMAVFSEPVVLVDTTDFIPVGTGVSGAAILGVNGGHANYLLVVDSGSGDGLLRVDAPVSALATDLMGNALSGLPFSGGDSYTVDKTAPTILAGTRLDPNPTNALSVDFAVTFSEAVTGVSAADFVISTTGAVSGAGVSGVTGSGAAYTVTVNTGSGDGTLRLDAPASATALDPAGNALSGLPFTSAEAYTIDKTAPTILSSTRLDPSPTNAARADFAVTFSEAVTGVSAADFVVYSSGAVSGAGVSGVTGSGATYTVTVNTGNGGGSLRLDAPASATVLDPAGNALSGLPFTSGEAYTIPYRVMLPMVYRNVP